jgi:hypothetical protein
LVPYRNAGANICLTGDLSILADAVNIPLLPITVALNGKESSLDDCCTKKGYIPLPLSDDTIHWQLCYYSANAVETITSLQAIFGSSDLFALWTMTGYKDNRPGGIRFDSHGGFISMNIPLVCRDGLYYCPTNIFTLRDYPVLLGCDTPSNALHLLPVPKIQRIINQPPPPIPRCSLRFEPTSKARQLESEVWLLCLGSPGVTQLDILPQNVTGLPATFEYHLFQFIDFKEQAQICKQAAQRSAVRTPERRRQFYIDFGFMRASTSDYTRRDKSKDRAVFSYDGFLSYLLIVDEASCYVWVFLINSKSPPLDIIKEFLVLHGHDDGGSVRTDQGGELTRSSAFQDMLLWDFHYTLEPTGTDSPSQNGAAEIYNDKFAIRTRTLLYGSGLPAKFWSVALLHSVYLHNKLVHANTKVTPFEGYFGIKPDLSNLKVFGSRVCIKRSGDRSGKLDCNDFTGIFLGFTATDHNINYLDLDSGIVKHSRHTIFDEAWYLQPNRPLAAQLLYDLGLEIDTEDDPADSGPTPTVPWPLLPTCNPHCHKFLDVPLPCLTSPLPLRETFAAYQPIAAAAARTFVINKIQHDNPAIAARVRSASPSDIVAEYLIGKHDMATVYMSPDPYFEAFKETLLASVSPNPMPVSFWAAWHPAHLVLRYPTGDPDSKVLGSSK